MVSDKVNKFKNVKLEAKINKISEEFDLLMQNTQLTPRTVKSFKVSPQDLINKRHESPTARLIAHKNSTVKHKIILSAS